MDLFPKNVIDVNLLDTQGLPAMTSHSNCLSLTQGPLRVTTLYLSWWRQVTTLQRQVPHKEFRNRASQEGPFTACTLGAHGVYKTRFWEGHPLVYMLSYVGNAL